jgi:nucleoside-diphosphate-sugar epimerase
MNEREENPSESVGIFGLGWVGKRLAESLQEHGVSVWGSVTTYEKAQILREKGVNAQVLRLPEVPPVSQLPLTDILVYTIPPRGGEEQAEEMIRSAIQIGEELGVRAAIFLSSTSVYSASGGWVTESDAEAIPSRHTGIQIKKLEELWSEAPFPTTILRFGGLYGPGRSPGRFMKDRTIKNPTAYVNMTHQRDAVESILRVIRKEVWGEVLNIVSVNNQTRKAFYSQFLNDPKVDTKVARPSKRVSVQRAQQLLGADFLAHSSGSTE